MTNVLSPDKAIGGYFELELPRGRGEYYPNAYCFQSARAAFHTLLQTGQPARVWMPGYLCDSMFEPLRQSGIPFALYTIDEHFEVADSIDLGEDEWLLYVNYFGVCDYQVARVLERFPPKQVVIDHTQAFFSPPPDCLATIYSPRKFFGVPDGGYLITDLSIPEPEREDDGSLERCAHLLKRLAIGPEYGYADYCAAGASLCSLSPLRMSQLTHRLLASIDYESARECRYRNFSLLHAQLGARNQLPLFYCLSSENIVAPLCYPLWPCLASLRENLQIRRIYLPTYWPDVKRDVKSQKWESSFSRNLMPLPSDQRYPIDTLINMVKIILDIMK